MVLILVSWLSGCSYSLLEWWSSSSALPQLYGEKLNIAFHLSLLHPNQRAKKNSTTWPMGYLGSRLRPHIIINRWRSRWAPSRWWWWWKNKLSLIVDETKKLNSSHDRALHVNHHHHISSSSSSSSSSVVEDICQQSIPLCEIRLCSNWIYFDGLFTFEFWSSHAVYGWP